MLKEGDIKVVKHDDRHCKGQIVKVILVSPKASDGKPYYCQAYPGQVCNWYGEDDLEEVKGGDDW